MLNIIIYTLCGIGIGFSLGMMSATLIVDRRTKKRQRDMALLIDNEPPYCYMEQDRDEVPVKYRDRDEEEMPYYYMMQEGPDEPDDYMEKCYEYELKCEEDMKK